MWLGAHNRSISAPSQGGGGGTFAPNRPGGLTTIVDRQWNTAQNSFYTNLSGTDPQGFLWFGGGPSPICATPASLSSTIGVTVPALPDGQSTALAIKYPSGFSSGQTPFGAAYIGTTISVKKYYHAAWVFMPSNFNPNSNNIKWMFHAQNGSRNHVLMLSSGTQGTDMIGPWMNLQGGGNSSVNVGGAGNTAPGAIYRLSTVSDADGCWDFRRNAWYCIEFYTEMETSTGAGDGIFKTWFNGTLTNHFTNIGYSTTGDPTVFDTASFTPYYGGGGGNAPADEYLVVGRFLVAGGN